MKKLVIAIVSVVIAGIFLLFIGVMAYMFFATPSSEAENNSQTVDSSTSKPEATREEKPFNVLPDNPGIKVDTSSIDEENEKLKHYQFYFDIAVKHMKKQEFEEAIENYKKALEYYTNDYRAYNNLGLIYEYKKEYHTSVDYFKKARKLNPDDSEIYNNLGFLYIQQKNFQEARYNLEKAYDLNPDNAFVLNNLGEVYYHLNDNTMALNFIKKSLNKNDKNPYAYKNLGLIYFKKKEYQKALENLKIANSLDKSLGLEENIKNLETYLKKK